MLLSFAGCNSVGIRPPAFEDCSILTNSIFCIDKRMNNSKVNSIIDYIESQDALDNIAKDELISYFNKNRKKIIKFKEFEIEFKHLGYFRGYFTTNPNDRFALESFMDKHLNELEKFRRRCGKYQEARMICN
jgi:hypothetical protein